MGDDMERIRKLFGSFSFYRSLFLLVFPIALQQLLSMGMSFFQTFLVGAYVKSQGNDVHESMLLVQIGNRYFLAFQALLLAVSITSSLFFAKYLGDEKEDALRKVMKANLVLSFFSALFMLVIGFLFRYPMLKALIQAKDSTISIHTTATFYLFLLLSLIPLSITNMFSYMLRNLKKTKYPLISTTISFLFHGLLSFILLYYTPLKIVGISVSFFLSRILETLILYKLYKKNIHFIQGFYKEKGYKGELFNILKKGWPVLLSQLLQESFLLLMFFAYARIAKGQAKELAAMNFVTQVADIAYAILGGMGTATAILIAIPLGKKKIEEARNNGRYIQGYVIVFSLILSLAMLIFLPIYQSLTGEDPFLKEVFILQIISLPFLFYSQNLMFIMRSAGYTKGHFWITIFPSLAIKVPFVILFVFFYPSLYEKLPFLETIQKTLGLTPSLLMFLYLLDRFLEIARAFIAFFLYHKVKWYERKLEKANEG